MQILKRVSDALSTFLVLFMLLGFLSTSDVHITSTSDRARPFTTGLGFDSITWTIQAVWLKTQQAALNSPHYISRVAKKELLLEYLRVTDDIGQYRNAIRQIYTDPAITDPDYASEDLRTKLRDLEKRQRQLAPFAEAMVEDQLSTVLSEIGLTTAGQPIPPVLYHITPLPMSLIISPRDTIREDASILLLPQLPIEQQESVEEKVANALGVSTLVVPVGGLGTYPTMVISVTDLRTLFDIVAHEWIHNYLTLRPLGINYGATPELRTMNETTASIAGGELSQLMLERFYPELADLNAPKTAVNVKNTVFNPVSETPPFDFRTEMHKTRIRVDELLAEGKIEEAENYMEERRLLFWDNGYAVRKLNQAYFAFYGAYADTPGGAAGEDPVGPAVRALRAHSPNLAAFINHIASMTSFTELQQAVGATP